MIFICLGFCSSPKSLYISAITEALDMSRGSFSINDSCRFITTAIINLFFGFLISKFGQKKLIAAGFLSLIASCITYSFASNVFTFCIGGVLLGIGLSWTTTTMVSSIIGKWFKNKKATILGFVLASNGIGGALATQILSPIIYSGNVFGYKNSYRLVALILAVVGTLIIIFLKTPPEDNETAVKHSKKRRGQTWSGIEYRDVFKKWYFYAIAVCIFLTGFILQSCTGVAAAHMKDTGIDASYIATVLSIHSIALTSFKFIVGMLYDKFGLRITTFTCYIATILSILALFFLTPTSTGKILAIIYGIISSLALPLETIMLPIYTSDLFGEKSFDKLLGLIVSINVAGYALGAPIINLWFDTFGSYKVAFAICIAIVVIIIVLLQFILNSAQKVKKELSE